MGLLPTIRREKRLSAAAGFTLVELLVVGSISAVLATLMIISFSRISQRVEIDQAVGIFVSDIRDMQSRALYGVKFGPSGTAAVPRCGYGVHQVNTPDNKTYLLYAGNQSDLPPPPDPCRPGTPAYQVGQDTIVYRVLLKDANVEFVGNWDDIFFEPPDPKVYAVNALLDSSSAPSEIRIRKVGTAGCVIGNCKVVKVYGSGRMEIADP